MNTDDFRVWGKHMVDYICKYLDELPNRRVIPDVEPGYLAPLLPKNAPEEPEKWDAVFKDVDDLILPGLTHWQHPRFHAYFASGNSFPSVMGEMLAAAIGSIGFSWAASPSLTELEIVTCDWLANLMELPSTFMHSEGQGGGVIQSSASDCVLLSMLAARCAAIEGHRHIFADAGDPSPDHSVLARLVAYSSELAHSCIEKGGMIAFCQVRQLPVDENLAITGEVLRQAIEEDKNRGLIPFYVCATMGSTAVCSFDDLASIGPVCEELNIWLHVDAAYAGSAFICPEFRHYLNGVEYAYSMNFNPNKWFLTNFDCSIFWVRDRDLLTQSMNVNPVYLQHKYSSKAVDLRHWGIPLSRKFRALKLWFVLRIYGATGLRAYIRNHVTLAKLFEQIVLKDNRFEVVGEVNLGLVCFRLKGSNTLTQCLIRAINESGELHMVPAMVNEKYVIRFVVVRETANEDDIHHAWRVISAFAEEIVTAQASLRQWRRSLCQKRSKARVVGILASPAVAASHRGFGDAGANDVSPLVVAGGSCPSAATESGKGGHIVVGVGSAVPAGAERKLMKMSKSRMSTPYAGSSGGASAVFTPGNLDDVRQHEAANRGRDAPVEERGTGHRARAPSMRMEDGGEAGIEHAPVGDGQDEHLYKAKANAFADESEDELDSNEDNATEESDSEEEEEDPAESAMASVLGGGDPAGFNSCSFAGGGSSTFDEGDLEDEDIIQLAEARLEALKVDGAIEAYNMLVKQLHNMGVTHVLMLDTETGEPISEDGKENVCAELDASGNEAGHDQNQVRTKSAASVARHRALQVNAAGISFEIRYTQQRKAAHEELLRKIGLNIADPQIGLNKIGGLVPAADGPPLPASLASMAREEQQTQVASNEEDSPAKQKKLEQLATKLVGNLIETAVQNSSSDSGISTSSGKGTNASSDSETSFKKETDAKLQDGQTVTGAPENFGIVNGEGQQPVLTPTGGSKSSQPGFADPIGGATCDQPITDKMTSPASQSVSNTQTLPANTKHNSDSLTDIDRRANAASNAGEIRNDGANAHNDDDSDREEEVSATTGGGGKRVTCFAATPSKATTPGGTPAQFNRFRPRKFHSFHQTHSKAEKSPDVNGEAGGHGGKGGAEFAAEGGGKINTSGWQPTGGSPLKSAGAGRHDNSSQFAAVGRTPLGTGVGGNSSILSRKGSCGSSGGGAGQSVGHAAHADLSYLFGPPTGGGNYTDEDLGLGQRTGNTLTRLRRQTLLRMISDPVSNNTKSLRIQCTCGASRKLHQNQQANANFANSMILSATDALHQRRGNSSSPGAADGDYFGGGGGCDEDVSMLSDSAFAGASSVMMGAGAPNSACSKSMLGEIDEANHEDDSSGEFRRDGHRVEEGGTGTTAAGAGNRRQGSGRAYGFDSGYILCPACRGSASANASLRVASSYASASGIANTPSIFGGPPLGLRRITMGASPDVAANHQRMGGGSGMPSLNSKDLTSPFVIRNKAGPTSNNNNEAGGGGDKMSDTQLPHSLTANDIINNTKQTAKASEEEKDLVKLPLTAALAGEDSGDSHHQTRVSATTTSEEQQHELTTSTTTVRTCSVSSDASGHSGKSAHGGGGKNRDRKSKSDKAASTASALRDMCTSLFRHGGGNATGGGLTVPDEGASVSGSCQIGARRSSSEVVSTGSAEANKEQVEQATSPSMQKSAKSLHSEGNRCTRSVSWIDNSHNKT